MSGPYESEQEALAAPAARDVYNMVNAEPGGGKLAPGNLDMLLRACHETGVAVGAYDLRVLRWLAGFEPQTCAVIAGLITRSHRLPPADLSTALAALDVAADELRDRVANCPDCQYTAGGQCTTCEDRLGRAAEYDRLAERLPAVTR